MLEDAGNGATARLARDADIWTVAAALSTHHPVSATDMAFAMAIYSLSAGDFEQSDLWTLVFGAIKALGNSRAVEELLPGPIALM